ncbi:MAG TPA: hypothetical protein VF676_03220 [Flavobacterium sp.]
MRYSLLILLFPLLLHCQNQINVTIKNARIVEDGDVKKLRMEYQADSLIISGSSQIRITDARAIFDDGRYQNLDYSEYYDIANSKPYNAIYFKIPRKNVYSVKSVKGKIEYYNPRVDNGDIKILENPKAKVNSRVLPEVSGLEFYKVDINALIRLKGLSRSKRYLRAQKIIGVPALTTEFKKSINDFFKYLDVSVFNQTGSFFYIYDPSDLFFTIRLIDKNGNLKNCGYSSSSDLPWKYFQVSGESMDSNLAFIFYSKNSVQEFDFIVENIKIENSNGL